MPDTTIITTPRDLKTKALEAEYHLAIAKNDLDRAYKAAENLLKIMPGTEVLKERLSMTDKIRAMNKAAQSVIYLGKFLEQTNQIEKIHNLVKSVPKEIENEQFASQMRQRFLPPRVWNKNEVAILCGPGFEFWSPKSIKTGLGGSEEAVVYLSKELTALGYKVTVYANPPLESIGDNEGVEYRQWYDFNAKDSFNILVLWRAIGMTDNEVNAKFTLLWCHDVPNNADYTEERLSKINKIAVLSEYHKSLFKMYKNGEFENIPEDKFFVTGNGILPIRYNKKWNRSPHSIIWSSSYDRGLVWLLNMWPEIKKQVPDATLDIYYGWNLYDIVHKGNPARAQWKTQMVKMMQQNGMKEHGRVGHRELERAFGESAVWGYSTDFQEISCISAMKAQAYGAIPVVPLYAALKESVCCGGLKLDIDITEKSGRNIYAKELISLLKDEKRQEEIRKTMMECAKERFLWSKIAIQWHELIKKHLPKEILIGGEENGAI